MLSIDTFKITDKLYLYNETLMNRLDVESLIVRGNPALSSLILS